MQKTEFRHPGEPADLRGPSAHEVRGSFRCGFRNSDLLQHFSQAFPVFSPVRSAAKLFVVEEPQWTDFFTAIQTSHVLAPVVPC
jgi:hypothetical protein